jgi:hypothetical protein
MTLGTLRARWRLLAFATGAMLVVSAGVAYAAIPDSNGVIHGCIKKSGGDDDDGGGKGSLRVIDTAKGESCKRKETALKWNQTGPAGTPGQDGEDGEDGEDGQDAHEEYGVATVNVTRGTTTSIWARYSTELGSPVGDTTSGTFRFTCDPDQAPCKVTIGASVLSDSSTAPAGFYPRLLLYRGGSPDGNIEPEFYCEYGDGPPQPLARESLASDPSDGPALPIHIGGSADCSGPDPAAGAVTQIVVPKGYYDVFATFVFVK